MRASRTVALAVAAAVTVTVVAGGGSAARAASPPHCGIEWGSVPKSDLRMTGGPVSGARIGRHRCYDRLVVDLAGGPTPGYVLRYTHGFHQPGSGSLLPVAGGAVLTVTALAPAYDADGRSTVPWRAGGRPVAPAGFSTFRDLVFGGSFEGESVFGLGVRARLPFRVFTLAGPGTGTRLVIDVAHRW